MEKSNELARRQDTVDLQSNVPTRCNEDEQLKEKFVIIDQLAAMLRGKEVSRKHRYGWIKFWSFLLVVVAVLGGGGYYLGSRNQQPSAEIDQAQVDKLVDEKIEAKLAKAEETRRAAELAKAEEARRAAEQKAEEARYAAEQKAEALIDRDVALGMPKLVARLKHWKLAKARKKAAEAYIPFKVLKADCAGLLAENGFSEANANDSVIYRQCREKVATQLQRFEIEAKGKAMNETAYLQTRTSYDEKIALLDGARRWCSEWQEAEQKLTDLQNWKQEAWISFFYGNFAFVCVGSIGFIVVLFLSIRYWRTETFQEFFCVGSVIVIPFFFVLCIVGLVELCCF